ncbi:MAG: PIG-L deacetylase family protein [Acidimicrobiales bacterium]
MTATTVASGPREGEAGAGDGGTARRWRRLLVRVAEWRPPPVPTVVVVPHPDDESLMFGGLIGHQRDGGVPVTVVAVTDGEAAYPDVDPSALALRRRGEQEAALAVLGVEPGAVVRLGLPDGEVASHHAAVTDAVADLTPPGGLLAAPWLGDHHCDHEATGRAVATAAARTGVDLVYGLFWTWHHTGPDRSAAAPLGRLPLADGGARRRRAMAEHRSQTTEGCLRPILGAAELEPILWEAEYHVIITAGSPAGFTGRRYPAPAVPVPGRR